MSDGSLREIKIKRLHPEWKLLGENPGAFADPESFSMLAKRFSEYVNYDDTLVFKEPVDSPVLSEVLNAAKSLGLSIQEHRGDKDAQVTIRDYPQREATLSELSASDAFECEVYKPLIAWGEPSVEANADVLTIRRSQELTQNADKEWGALSNLFHLLVVRSEFRSRLEESGLKGMSLVELSCQGGWPGSIAPLWLIWSSELLMPVGQVLFDNDGRVFRSEEIDFQMLDRECYLIDGYVVNPRLSYTQNPLRGLDIALTRERIGGKSRCYHKIVYSRKAVDVFREIGLECSWIPVHIGA